MSKIPKYSTTTTIDPSFSGFSTLSDLDDTIKPYPYPRDIFKGIEEIMGLDILTKEQVAFLDELYNTGNESDMTIAKEMFMTILRGYETTKKEEEKSLEKPMD